jgi:hypothetical protein
MAAAAKRLHTFLSLKHFLWVILKGMIFDKQCGVATNSEIPSPAPAVKSDFVNQPDKHGFFDCRVAQRASLL